MYDVLGTLKTWLVNFLAAAWANPKTTLVITLILVVVFGLYRCM